MELQAEIQRIEDLSSVLGMDSMLSKMKAAIPNENSAGATGTNKRATHERNRHVPENEEQEGTEAIVVSKQQRQRRSVNSSFQTTKVKVSLVHQWF